MCVNINGSRSIYATTPNDGSIICRLMKLLYCRFKAAQGCVAFHPCNYL
ncbi:MAG: hypothetical protein VB140_04145 [Burkholderia sp.]